MHRTGRRVSWAGRGEVVEIDTILTKHQNDVLETATELCAARAITKYSKGACLHRVRDMLGMCGMVKKECHVKLERDQTECLTLRSSPQHGKKILCLGEF